MGPRAAAYDSFLLVSFGGPERAEDVLPFLERVTAGRGIPPARVRAVAEHYYQAGGASPVNARCRELLAAVGPQLADLGLSPYWGNRNWHPLLEDTVAAMRDRGMARAVAFVTSAYGGYSSCRQYLDDIAAARAKVGKGAPEISKLRLYFNHPGWVQAWSSSVSEAVAKGRQLTDRQVEVFFSAHSVPEALARTSPYVEQVTDAARLAAIGAGVEQWRLVWQSRSGNPASPWLGPDICDAITASEAGCAVVVPIGFVCENMEIVHDLDVEAAQAAAATSMPFVRAAAVSGHPAFVRMVADLVRERLSPRVSPAALGSLGPWPDQCPEEHCPAPVHRAS
ncbi:MAG TPA: ferrochelatase [Acidimicrobiales bacterium]|nr:ferrochelatase [Acidimicrobiales bacterium]